jgi:hypothetical protein
MIIKEADVGWLEFAKNKIQYPSIRLPGATQLIIEAV